MIVGFDFGTTNSLISFVRKQGDSATVEDLTSTEDGLPYPSVVRYDGEAVVVGRLAKSQLSVPGIGVHENTVRSPKRYLGSGEVRVAGVPRHPIDIAAEVIRFVKEETERNPRFKMGAVDQVVATIPVSMDGEGRTALREAFALSGISVFQFIHEPFAALYGYLNNSADPEKELRRIEGKNILVVDWGGGTLDVTLCRVTGTRLVQIRSAGSDAVGGDYFDYLIKDEILKRSQNRRRHGDSDSLTEGAEQRLLVRAEENKIQLSTTQEVSFYLGNFYGDSGDALDERLSRSELAQICAPLIHQGIALVREVVGESDETWNTVHKCVVVGGMSQMPSVQSELMNMFGLDRVIVPENASTLVSQGAAWMAHNEQRLSLAKPVELETARGEWITVLRAGTLMPVSGQVQNDQINLYCTDPTDGIAKLPIATPRQLMTSHVSQGRREALGTITLPVNQQAHPFQERLKLSSQVDQDLVLTLSAYSSISKDPQELRVINLEFSIGLFTDQDLHPISSLDFEILGDLPGIAVRANTSESKDTKLIPGDVLYKTNSRAFSPGGGATASQKEEHLFNEPCSVCKREWTNCGCAS